jgi:hypothetical protein
VSTYQDLKAKAGQLDFLDLLIKARDLIRDNGNVRAELQQRFAHYFVDEFQDTDPLQAEILLLLAANDSSQSDYDAQRIGGFLRFLFRLSKQLKPHVVVAGGYEFISQKGTGIGGIRDEGNAAFAGIGGEGNNGYATASLQFDF